MSKFWIVSELFPPDETSTSYILGEIANACAKKYDVNVICGPEIYDRGKQIDTQHPFILNSSIQVHRVHSSVSDKSTKLKKTLSLLSMSVKLYKQAKRLINKGDRVLLVTNPAPLIILVSRLRKKVDFELLLLVHDVFPENLNAHKLSIPHFLYSLIKKVSDRAYARADKLIALGRDMKRVLQNKVGENKTIAIIENWADIENINPRPFPDSDRIILQYAGNMGRAQGLVRLISELPDGVELHFYGTGAVENELKQMNHPNVFFHGSYFRSQQDEILGSCHASIVSLSEKMYGIGVPSKSYNIMASGRPIIYFGPSGSEIELTIKEHHIGYIGWPEKWIKW